MYSYNIIFVKDAPQTIVVITPENLPKRQTPHSINIVTTDNNIFTYIIIINNI